MLTIPGCVLSSGASGGPWLRCMPGGCRMIQYAIHAGRSRVNGVFRAKGIRLDAGFTAMFTTASTTEPPPGPP